MTPQGALGVSVFGVVGILAAAGVISVFGYLVMFDVKPKGERPTLGVEAAREIQDLEHRLMRHVHVLGGEIGERHLLKPEGLLAAASYIRQAWSAQGLSVTEEAFEVSGQRCANLVVEQEGGSRPEEIVLVGAHYDSIIGSPGANDNATGVAVLLEMPRILGQATLPRTVRFVAFVNEEPPYFHTERMGSRLHARKARERGERIVAMISLETLGFYSDTPGSQRYPFPLGAFYPDTANFLGVVGNLASRRLVIEFLKGFMRSIDFPVEGAATFSWIPGVDWSDHWSFWTEGYLALMVTDTAPYRYSEYHSFRDLPENVIAPEFARAAHGIIGAVRQLAASG
ncbi:MAG: M28 family peptidase [Candidatus Methylomirabilia bacterium]